MRKFTRQKYNAYVSRIALVNGVESATEKFTVTPSVQQKLIDKQQESIDFLSKINFIPVTEKSAEILGLSVTATIAGRTATSAPGTPRQPSDPTGMDGRTYECKKTNFDTFVSYDKLDTWAKFPDFQARLANHVALAQARDRIRIGFNGTSAAPNTDRAAHPNLEDVNIGWLQKLRTEKPAAVLDEVVAASGKVTYGAGGDYIDLDAIAWDARETLIPVEKKDDPDLVCIISNDLLHDKYFGLVNSDLDPQNKRARDELLKTKTLGGMPPFVAPFFPAGTMFITTFANLSLYQQEEGNRRNIKDEPEYDRITDYQSSNDAYVIEDIDLAALVENIQAYVAP